jgi:hypothetical protein
MPCISADDDDNDSGLSFAQCPRLFCAGRRHHATTARCGATVVHNNNKYSHWMLLPPFERIHDRKRRTLTDDDSSGGPCRSIAWKSLRLKIAARAGWSRVRTVVSLRRRDVWHYWLRRCVKVKNIAFRCTESDGSPRECTTNNVESRIPNDTRFAFAATSFPSKPFLFVLKFYSTTLNGFLIAHYDDNIKLLCRSRLRDALKWAKERKALFRSLHTTPICN